MEITWGISQILVSVCSLSSLILKGLNGYLDCFLSNSHAIHEIHLVSKEFI